MKNSISFLLGLIIIYGAISACSDQKETPEDPLFASFSGHREHDARYRVALKTDTPFYHFEIRAITTATFDDSRYTPSTFYIFKHEKGDSIVIRSSDMPLFDKEQFEVFYNTHREQQKADTIINADFLNQFYLKPSEKFGVEKIEKYPFVFMDVNFDGYPELLVRESDDYGGYCRFRIYGITAKEFKLLAQPPFNAFKNAFRPYTGGGDTELDYVQKTIKVWEMEPSSCPCHGTIIEQTYTLDSQSGEFDCYQTEHRYDHDDN